MAATIDSIKTAKAQAKWDRNARFYARIMTGFMDGEMAKRWYAKLWGEVSGSRVLEAGVGTGSSFAYYPQGYDITAIDFSKEMLARAKIKARKLGLSIDLKQMDVQKLDFADNTFDTVIACCTFCSVPNPVLGLRELRRVVRPDGKVLLLEHMRHDNIFIGKFMDWLNPLVVRFIGPAINRRTLDNIRASGMTIETVENLAMGGILKFVVARPAKVDPEDSRKILPPCAQLKSLQGG